MKKAIGLFAMCLVGCASSASYIRGADGSDWVSITCRRNQSNCFERAGEECPSGYEVMSNAGRAGSFTQVNQYGGYTIPTYNGELLIKCKLPEVAMVPIRTVSPSEPVQACTAFAQDIYANIRGIYASSCFSKASPTIANVDAFCDCTAEAYILNVRNSRLACVEELSQHKQELALSSGIIDFCKQKAAQ